MTDVSNLLSTPYATPAQIKSTYDYAKALMYGPQQQSVHHWTQGVSNMVNALVGGNLDYQANQRERARELYDAGNRVKLGQESGAFGNPPQNFSEGPPPAGQANNAGDPLSKAMRITSSQESGGNYGALGPVVARGSGRQDRAYGKYQIMGENIPVWTQEALGQSLTPAQFLASPEAQDATYRHKMGQYIAQYGPEGAARAWLGGPGGVNHPERRDSLGTSVGDYGHRFAMAYNGATPVANDVGSQAIISSLRGEGSDTGGTQVAAARGSAIPKVNPQQLVAPAGQPQGGPYIDPRLVRPQTNFSPETLRNVFASGSAADTPEFKNLLFGSMLQQGQPLAIPYMGGIVRIDPHNPQNQQFIPNVEFKTIKMGDFDIPVATFPDGRGGYNTIRITPNQQTAPPAGVNGPRSEATPSAAPTSAPQGGLAPGASPIQAQAQNAPEPATAAPSKPVQVASLEPNAGVTPEAKPAGVTPAVVPAPTTAEASTPLAKFAQAGPPPGSAVENLVGRDLWNAYGEKKQFDTEQQVNLEQEKKQVELGFKDYEQLKQTANDARNLIPNVEEGFNLLNDPRTHTGMIAGAQDIWSRFKEAVLGEKGANAPNEVLDKLLAGNVLALLRPTTQGTGQVRLAEINLLRQANASRYYGDSANRAVLEISRRALDKMDKLGTMADQYVLGQDVVDPSDPKKILLPAGQGKRHGLDAGWNQIASKWVTERNKADEALYKDTEKLFNTGRDPTTGAKLYERGEGGKPPSDPQIGQPWTFKQGVGIWNGQTWVPQDQYKPQAPVSK